MALVLPFSLSLSYVPLTLALILTLYAVARGKARYPKDFLLFIILYGWRALTLILNGLSLKPLKDLYDKVPYPVFSVIRFSERRFNLVMLALGLSSSVVALLGIATALLGAFRTGWVYTECVGNCEISVKRPTEVVAVVLTDRERNYFVNGPRLTYGFPVHLKPGRYTFYSYAGAIVKVRRGDVSLGSRWHGRFEERRFYNFTSFVGFYDHKMHSGAVFAILTIVFLVVGMFYRWPYLAFVPPLSFALVLTEAKAYRLVAFLLSIAAVYLKLKMFRLYPYTLLGTLPVVVAALLYSPLRDGFLWSLNARLNFWKIGFETFPSSPVLGIGYDHISVLLRPYYERGVVDNAAHLHSSYLNALVETGVVGLVLTLTLTLYFAIKFLMSAKRGSGYARAFSLGVGLSIILVGVVGAVETNYDTAILNLLLTFLMGVGYALSEQP
jgi:hypothetical protein